MCKHGYADNYEASKILQTQTSAWNSFISVISFHHSSKFSIKNFYKFNNQLQQLQQGLWIPSDVFFCRAQSPSEKLPHTCSLRYWFCMYRWCVRMGWCHPKLEDTNPSVSIFNLTYAAAPTITHATSELLLNLNLAPALNVSILPF